MHPELIQYIKDQRAAGVPDEVIEKATQQSGWAVDEVRAIFTSLGPATPKAAEPVVLAQKEEVPAEKLIVAGKQSGTLRLLLNTILFLAAIVLATAGGYLFGQADKVNSEREVIVSTPTASPTP